MNSLKTKVIWKGNNKVDASVRERSDGGLLFCYCPLLHIAQPCLSTYSLYSEVGEKYKKYFNGFFEKHQLSEEPLVIADHPYVLDRLKP